MTQKRKFYFVGGGKGGVGKSLATMALLDYLRIRGDKPYLIETDTSNPDVAKSYSASVETELIDLDTRDGWLAMLNRCGGLEDRTVVVNTGARNNSAINRFGDLLAAGLEELELELVVLWLINEHRDSLELLRQFRLEFPAACVHVMRNEHCSSAFELYDGSQLRRDIESHGGNSLTFPDLAARVTRELYERRMTLEAAANPGTMPLGNRMEMLRWRKQVGHMFDQVVA